MIDFDEKINKIKEEQETTNIDYSFTIERINILKTISFTFDKLSEGEMKQVKKLIEEEIKLSKNYDETKSIYKKSMEQGNGLINFERDLKIRKDRVNNVHAYLENLLYNTYKRDYTNQRGDR